MNKIYEIYKEDKNYPPNLLKIRKPPKKLYVMGNVSLLTNPSVAIVGSRDSTSYGEFNASIFSQELSKAGITVVSGLAVGIDSVAHVNSMKEEGRTIAVIGSGLNNIYPPENINLAKQIIENGGTIVSEYPPEKEADLSKFPLRNRIIAGLAECTIVVEAKYKSGSGITARHAFEQKKQVFCVPGRIGDKTSKGTNNLIKNGANILTDINEVLELFGKKNENIKHKPNIKIPNKYSSIYKLISKKEMNINEISRDLNIGVSELNIKLTMMELDGLIEISPGNIIKIKE